MHEFRTSIAAEIASLCSASTALVACFLIACLLLLDGVLPVHERPVPMQEMAFGNGTVFVVRDLALDHKYLPDHEQLCPFWLLLCLTSAVPLAAMTGGLLVCRKVGDAVAFMHGYMMALACMAVTVTCLKHYCGVLRPYFYGECGFSEATHTCLYDVADAHESFPSGHSGHSFATLLFASLYLLGKVNAAKARHVELPLLGRLEITNVLILFSLAPTALAFWIAASRVVDNDHSPADVVGGGVIGATWASLWYGRYFPCIWAENSSSPAVRQKSGLEAPLASLDRLC
ncbi:unnamed protein product [Polarella glacialis]|uniref:Phosphatidic acid phosphatase type 2/haloperoxidase domain-containing protein n=1 Tax=Polarella glacialis TaxID=89957 RepID=A0A813KEM2_POLGL|nr:unnamed protein product [Polarella glacialis]CAE8698036.1 unnamed protein product [Polarella glacialis]